MKQIWGQVFDTRASFSSMHFFMDWSSLKKVFLSRKIMLSLFILKPGMLTHKRPGYDLKIPFNSELSAKEMQWGVKWKARILYFNHSSLLHFTMNYQLIFLLCFACLIFWNFEIPVIFMSFADNSSNSRTNSIVFVSGCVFLLLFCILISCPPYKNLGDV